MENRCLYCNEIIPEGIQVCPICQESLGGQSIAEANHEEEDIEYETR